ncbi:hypothetical protein FHG87_024646, partial [Trinorchestia longiramus]
TIGSFFSYKDKLPSTMQASLVYSYSCARCASEYVGMTTRALGARMAEHFGVSYRTGARLTSPSHSAVRDHAETCNTIPHSSHFKVVRAASSVLDLRILESLFIFKCKPSLNNQLSSYPLTII